ncbi:MAG: DUF2589 domain-containing protein [Oscillospiraceae bacterium]|nr:DUF2589 domain-containing protein [Oscillospiraceae bacterium]
MAAAQDFVGLPLGLLICQPILEVAKGQQELCSVYLETIMKLAFEDNKDGGDKPYTAKTIKFTINRVVFDKASGKTNQVPVQVEAPLLSLVPVPAFTMDEATVNFSMEVKDQIVDTNSVNTEASTSISASYWGCKATISGKVTTAKSNTRTSDTSAKYEIYARAVQQPPAEGMAKLTSLFASVVEPMEVSGQA